MLEEVAFPPVEFVRQGPPVHVRDIDRRSTEKWARIMVVTPVPRDGGRHDFTLQGPITLPMAVRRAGTDLGSKDAWKFYTHPYAVFPREATYYNVEGKGCLGARLYVRSGDGVRLYDEVGASLSGAEKVADTIHGALGVLRQRAAHAEGGSPYLPDLLELDLDLLEVFRLSTFLLQTRSPQETLGQLLALMQRSGVRAFCDDVFDADDLSAMRMATRESDPAELRRLVSRFHVDEADFTRVADVRDGRGRQAIQELLGEYQAFQSEHGARLAELSLGIQEQTARIEDCKRRIRELQAEDRARNAVTRFFSRTPQAIKELKAEGVHAVRTRRELEAAFDAIPGYDRVRGLTERVQGFQQIIASVHRLARDLFDHTVSQAQLKSLRVLVHEKVVGKPPAEAQAGYRSYDLRLRAEALPRLVSTYSISAYVLRRPDALRGGHSLASVQRINRLARNLIEYFGGCRYGNRTLADAFAETWGQVLGLEARL